VHLLAAVVSGHRLQPLLDESVFLGLGDAAEEGSFGPEVRGRFVASLVAYADAGRRLGAAAIAFVGTQPFRRAADADDARREVEAATGIPLDVLTHEEEAYLTLIGVSGARRLTGELVVVDVGGGSTEVVVHSPGGSPVAVGLRLGSAQLTRSVVEHDPPLTREIDELRAQARASLKDAPDAAGLEIVAVGGTATNLLRLIPAATLDQTLDRRRLEEALATLAVEPAEQVAERHAVNRTRAQILPAGAAILEAVLYRYDADLLQVADASIREGLVLVLARGGHDWRVRIPEFVSGWTR